MHLSQLKKSTSVNRSIIIPNEDVDDFNLLNNTTQPMSLSSSQEQQLDHVLNSFPSVFSDIPGATMLATHSITLTTTIHLWSPPYSIPLAHQTAFREEIENLLSLGIIEPSTSKYSSSPMPVSIRKMVALE